MIYKNQAQKRKVMDQQKNRRIFLSSPHMGGDELRFIDEAFESNYIAPVGANLSGFEEDIKSYTGSKNALAVSSGTAAIHLALKVLGVGAGDKVIASSFTFIGSVSPIVFAGAEPIFVDSNYASWNADPNLLEEAFRREKPKAFILTHLYGQMAEIEAINYLCDKYGVYLIEDSAESLGATFAGKQSGSFGKMGIFSFNGNKIITTSGGGMLISDDESLIKKARFLSTQAKEDFLHYEHLEIGFNYRMSNVVAGIGRGQMMVLDKRIARKREIFDQYQKNLADQAVEFMPEIAGSVGNRWLTTLVIRDGKTKPDQLIKALENENIESRPLWKPMHKQPVFAGSTSYTNGVSEELFANGICLPSSTTMSDQDVARVSEIIKTTLQSGFLRP